MDLPACIYLSLNLDNGFKNMWLHKLTIPRLVRPRLPRPSTWPSPALSSSTSVSHGLLSDTSHKQYELNDHSIAPFAVDFVKKFL